MKRIAVLDANVLFPQNLRDTLVSIAFEDAFGARWTNQIHDEWTRNVLKKFPSAIAANIQRTRRLMDEQLPGSLIENYEHLIPTVQLPDADDSHVLAAAIQGGAQTIVTFNLSDFPARILQNFQHRSVRARSVFN